MKCWLKIKTITFTTFSNDNDNGNRMLKWAIGFIKQKKKLCKCSTLFGTFLCHHCTITTRERLISRFLEDIIQGTTNFLPLSKIECSPYNNKDFNSWKIRLHLKYSVNWNKCDKPRVVCDYLREITTVMIKLVEKKLRFLTQLTKAKEEVVQSLFSTGNNFKVNNIKSTVIVI